jgi:anti-anti-sigma regulatory factor
MKINLEGSVAYLQGDLTLSKMTREGLDSLSDSLQLLETENINNIDIDCDKVDSSDIHGIQLLDVWRECAGFMGIETKLVNVSESMQQAMSNIKCSKAKLKQS